MVNMEICVNNFRRDVAVHFVNIFEIVDHHCLD